MDSSLPLGWVLCKFGDIARIRNGYAFKSTDFKKAKTLDSDVPLIRQSQLSGSAVDLSDAVYLPYEFLEEHSDYVVKKNDILIGMSGAIGKMCRYEYDFPSLQNQRTGKIEAHGEARLDSRFFGLYLSSVESELIRRSKGMGVQNISAKDIEALPLCLPPYKEQSRIVAKIEALFSELDKGVEALKTAREQLKVYRQAVLKHAFEGRLTEKWREESAEKLEYPNQLLASIQRERECQYQQQLAEWKAAVKVWEEHGKDGEKPGKPIEPTTLEMVEKDVIDELPALPTGWAWMKVSDVGVVETGNTPSKKKAEFYGHEYPFFKPTDLEAGYNVVSAREYLSKEGFENSRQLPENSILITCIGATIGKAGIIRTKGASNQQINSIIPKGGMEPDFVYFQAIGPLFQQQVHDGYSSTTLPILNKSKFCELVMAVCAVEEQRKIVAAVTQQLSSIDYVEEGIDRELKRGEVLRRSILKKAFSGQLVPQGPNDEPASALLERILAEKAAKDNSNKKSKRKQVA